MGVYYFEDADGQFVRLGFFRRQRAAREFYCGLFDCRARQSHCSGPFRVRSERVRGRRPGG